MSHAEDQGFTIPVQLGLEKSDANTHTLQDGDETNRKNITDDSTDGFLIKITLDKVIHAEPPSLLTFIGLEFRFEGIDDRRRFRYVEVNIRFEDVTDPLSSRDPEVVELWPNGPHVWKQTDVNAEVNISGDMGIQGGPGCVGGSANGAWAKKSSYGYTDQATFSGTARLLEKRTQREPPRKVRGGQTDPHRNPSTTPRVDAAFRAYFEVEAKADMKFSWANGLKKLRGIDHKTDPVKFVPGNDYLGWQDVAGITKDQPDAAMVRSYGDAMAWIELDPVRKYERKEGEWRETEDKTNVTGAEK
ncbi:hypothetical protein Trisim1_001415 [Trichoderma cf. simile WF8]